MSDDAPSPDAAPSPAETPDGAKIYDAVFAPSADRLARFADLAAVVRQLRRDCPWDRKQTHDSVKHLLIEETYEAVEAIDQADWDGLKGELGDLLLHVLFHSTIAEQDGRFTLDDVIEAETAKLVRRHPHVFGDAEASDEAAVTANWEAIKQAERAEAGAEQPSALDGVPAHLPALLRAQRVQEKAAGVGFDFPDAEDAWMKVEEELAELRVVLNPHDQEDDSDAREAEFGDLLFALTNFARFLDITPENALRRTIDTFSRRFRYVETRLADQGLTWDDVSLGETDVLWDEAKMQERLG